MNPTKPLDKQFVRMQNLAGIITEQSDDGVPSDVKNLKIAQQAATTVQNKAKYINTAQEFSGAFENWFKTLGFEPTKISKSMIRSEVEKILSKLGYK